jgi:hypothetical protein
VDGTCQILNPLIDYHYQRQRQAGIFFRVLLQLLYLDFLQAQVVVALPILDLYHLPPPIHRLILAVTPLHPSHCQLQVAINASCNLVWLRVVVRPEHRRGDAHVMGVSQRNGRRQTRKTRWISSFLITTTSSLHRPNQWEKALNKLRANQRAPLNLLWLCLQISEYYLRPQVVPP